MMQQPHVLILTGEEDVHTDLLIQELDSMGCRWSRLDPGWFPTQVSMSARLTTHGWGSILHCPNNPPLDLSEITSVWWRRPHMTQAAPHLPALEREFIETEARYGFVGLLRSLPVLWVNHPAENLRASFKPHQLQIASQLGLCVPPSLLTNDPDEFQRFYQEHHGQVIYKTLSTPVLMDEGIAVSTYTEVLTSELFQQATQVQYTAHLFQRYVDKQFELRIIVIGEKIFAVEIHNQHSELAKVDWRRQYADLRYQVHHLSGDVQEKIHQLMKAFRLTYSAIDMAVSPTGEYVFFEINPNGQFAFCQEATGLPLFPTLASLLAGIDSP